MAFDSSTLCLCGSNNLYFSFSRSSLSIRNSHLGEIGIASTTFSRTSTSPCYSPSASSVELDSSPDSNGSLGSPRSFDQRTRIATSPTRTQKADCSFGSFLAEECRWIVGQRTRDHSGDDAESRSRDRIRGMFLLFSFEENRLICLRCADCEVSNSKAQLSRRSCIEVVDDEESRLQSSICEGRSRGREGEDEAGWRRTRRSSVWEWNGQCRRWWGRREWILIVEDLL